MTKDEKKFMEYWAVKRQVPKSLKDYMKGFSIGIVIGIGIFICLVSGWYQRANMEANSNLSPIIILLSLIIICLFIGYFYYQFTWDNNEQKYKELQVKERKEGNTN